MFRIVDLDMFRDNPVENKHRKLVRSHRNGPIDRDLKPNSKIRDDLNVYHPIYILFIMYI